MAVTRTRTRPVVRLRAAPPLDPPYDDELTLVTWVRGNTDQLELDLDGDSRRAPTGALTSGSAGAGSARATRCQTPEPAGRPGLPNRGAAPGSTAETTAAPVGPPADAVATATVEAQRAARRFLDTALEMFNGYRPVAHVRALTTPGLAAGLIEQLRTATERLPRPGRPGRPPTGPRLRRLSLRVCEPRPGVAEAAAAIGDNGRTWALAFRLERQRSRWIAVLVRLI